MASCPDRIVGKESGEGRPRVARRYRTLLTDALPWTGDAKRAGAKRTRKRPDLPGFGVVAREGQPRVLGTPARAPAMESLTYPGNLVRAGPDPKPGPTADARGVRLERLPPALLGGISVRPAVAFPPPRPLGLCQSSSRTARPAGRSEALSPPTYRVLHETGLRIRGSTETVFLLFGGGTRHFAGQARVAKRRQPPPARVPQTRNVAKVLASGA